MKVYEYMKSLRDWKIVVTRDKRHLLKLYLKASRRRAIQRKQRAGTEESDKGDVDTAFFKLRELGIRENGELQRWCLA